MVGFVDRSGRGAVADKGEIVHCWTGKESRRVPRQPYMPVFSKKVAEKKHLAPARR